MDDVTTWELLVLVLHTLHVLHLHDKRTWDPSAQGKAVECTASAFHHFGGQYHVPEPKIQSSPHRHGITRHDMLTSDCCQPLSTFGFLAIIIHVICFCIWFSLRVPTLSSADVLSFGQLALAQSALAKATQPTVPTLLYRDGNLHTPQREVRAHR